WGIVAAAVVHFAAEPLSPSPIGLALIACSLVTSVALLFVARTFNDETAAPHPAGAESASEDDHRIRLRKAAAILWMPLVGACITCFIFGLTWDPVISSE
ncbi:MAG: LuxR family transcriptional regulator, partial [Eggerthella sp.]|nr:LuxR family transcriptional regulator [Eggerthella sp.]